MSRKIFLLRKKNDRDASYTVFLIAHPWTHLLQNHQAKLLKTVYRKIILRKKIIIYRAPYAIYNKIQDCIGRLYIGIPVEPNDIIVTLVIDRVTYYTLFNVNKIKHNIFTVS